MEKIQIGRWTIRTAKSLKRKILEGKSKAEKGSFNKNYWQCVGIYDTRIFGLVFYRNNRKDYDLFNY